MLALDTNVLLRYLTQDDPSQSAVATEFLENRLSARNPGFVSLVVLCEMAWTLRRTYKLSPFQISDIVGRLLAYGQLVIDQRDVVVAALDEKDSDLPDAIIHHLGLQRGCSETVTFDARFAMADRVQRLG